MLREWCCVTVATVTLLVFFLALFRNEIPAANFFRPACLRTSFVSLVPGKFIVCAPLMSYDSHLAKNTTGHDPAQRFEHQQDAGEFLFFASFRSLLWRSSAPALAARPSSTPFLPGLSPIR